MNYLYLLLFLVSCATVSAMENTAQKQLAQARKHVEASFKAEGKASLQFLRKANLCAQRALQQNPNGLTDELNLIAAFVKSVHAIQKDAHDEALACCYDVVSGPVDTPLVRRIKQESWGLVKSLADDKHHAISQFFLMKHLLRSKRQDYVQEGLKRFDALPMITPSTQGVTLGKIFACSEVLDDLKKLADVDANPQAQFLLGEIHLFQAERGACMDGSSADCQEELQKALAYGQQSDKGNYPRAHKLIELIYAAQENARAHSKVHVVDVVDQFEKGVSVDLSCLTQHSAPLQRSPSLKLLATLQLYKNVCNNDHRKLYEYGKKLLADPNDQIWLVGMDYLKRAVELGNAFAAERLGDELRELQPEQAAAHYYKALDVFTHAPSGSYWRDAGCFRRRDIEWKLGVLASTSKNVNAYQLACESGNAAAVEQHVYGIHNKNNIDELAVCVHALESEYVQDKNNVETSVLEALQTSGILRYMELFRESNDIQNVLINALSLRAHIGRGFVLKERTALAHYKKALHFIINPKEAAQVPFDEPVADAVFLAKIKIDKLPVQHRILYLEGMLGIIDALRSKKDTLKKKEARYVCELSTLAACAFNETKDKNLKLLHAQHFNQLLSCMPQVALVTQSVEHMSMIGNCCFAACVDEPSGYGHLEAADQLLTRVIQSKGNKKKNVMIQEVESVLASVKVLQARLLFLQGNQEEARDVYRQAVKYNPDDLQALWELAQVLMEGGQIALRQEGLEIIERLASKYRHRAAKEFMVAGYCGYKKHIIAPDTQKAITYLLELIRADKPDDVINRLVLAKIYYQQAVQSKGIIKQKLIAKVQDLVRIAKKNHDSAHLLYLDTLYVTDRTQEALHELDRYVPAAAATESEIYDLADAYFKRAQSESSHLGRKLFEKAEQLLQRIKHSSDGGYILLLNALLQQGSFDQLAQELAIPKKGELECLRECFIVLSLLLQHKHTKFDEVIEHYERAFETFERHIIEFAAWQDAQDLIEMIDGLGVSEGIVSTHPLKESTFKLFEKVSELLGSMIIEGGCPAQLRACMHAYNEYFKVKIKVLRSFTSATYDDVLQILGKAIEAAHKADDQACKVKLLKLICDQTHYWTDEPASGTIAVRAKTVSCLIGLCTKLCKDNDAAFLQTPFHDIVVYADRIIGEFDLSACTADERQTVSIHQQIVARHKSNLKDT